MRQTHTNTQQSAKATNDTAFIKDFLTGLTSSSNLLITLLKSTNFIKTTEPVPQSSTDVQKLKNTSLIDTVLHWVTCFITTTNTHTL